MKLSLEKSYSTFAAGGRGQSTASSGNTGVRLVAVTLLLLVLVIGSALGVIYSSYKSRQLFSELQQLNKEATHLEEDWGRLLLEQSTWASHSRIERIATSQLDMEVPDSSDIVVVEQ